LFASAGGANTAEYCLKAIESDCPCIFIENTGGCADIFAVIQTFSLYLWNEINF
jgi:hypothetical protein